MAIYFNYDVSVRDNKAEINKNIYLYQGNRNIDYYFTIKELPFKFSKPDGENIIEKLSPTHAAVTLLRTSDKVEVGTGKAEVLKDKIKLTITKEMIDETVEVGKYTMVIDLLDDEKDSIVTLPPIVDQFEILPRVTSLGFDGTSVINEAVVGQAMTTSNVESLNVFDGQGNYLKTIWTTGDKITKENLNKIEEAIESSTARLKYLPRIIDFNICENLAPSRVDTDDYSVNYAVFDNLSLGNGSFSRLICELTTSAGGTEETVKMTLRHFIDNIDMFPPGAILYSCQCDVQGIYDEIIVSNKYYSAGDIVVDKVCLMSSYGAGNTVTKLTLRGEAIENLMPSEYLEGVEWSSIDNIPIRLVDVVNQNSFTLTPQQYNNLMCDNIFISTIDRINESPYATSSPNNTMPLGNDEFIRVNAKKSQKGKGQKIKVNRNSTYYIRCNMGKDVIIDVVSEDGNTILHSLNNSANVEDFLVTAFTVPQDYAFSYIYIIFSVNDSVVDFLSNCNVSDLIVNNMGSKMMFKKSDIPKMEFNSAGELQVTIKGVTKAFVPKA